MSQEAFAVTRTGTPILFSQESSPSQEAPPKAKRSKVQRSTHGSTGRFTKHSIPDSLLINVSRFLAETDISQWALSCSKFNSLSPQMYRTFTLDPDINWDDKATAADFFKRFTNSAHVNVLRFPQREFCSNLAAANIAAVIKESGFKGFQTLRFTGAWPAPFVLSPLFEACPRLCDVDFVRRHPLNISDSLAVTSADDSLLPLSFGQCTDLRFFDAQYFSSPHHISYDGSANQMQMRTQLLSPEQLEKHLKNWPHLEAISIPGSFTDRHIALIAKNAPKLRNISFQLCNRISPRAMMELVQQCPLLERIDVDQYAPFLTKEVFKKLKECCKNFHALIATDSALNNEQLVALSEVAPQLTTLATSCRFTDYTNDTINTILPLLSNLRHFSLRTDSASCPLDTSVIPSIGKHCPKLRSLYLSGFGTSNNPTKISSEDVLQAASQLPDLEFLGLHFYGLKNREKLQTLGKACPRLRFVTLALPGKFSIPWMNSFIESLPDLRYVRVHKEVKKSLLNGKKTTEVFPQLLDLVAIQDSPAYSDQLLHNWGLPTERIWPPSTKALPPPEKTESKSS